MSQRVHRRVARNTVGGSWLWIVTLVSTMALMVLGTPLFDEVEQGVASRSFRARAKGTKPSYKALSAVSDVPQSSSDELIRVVIGQLPINVHVEAIVCLERQRAPHVRIVSVMERRLARHAAPPQIRCPLDRFNYRGHAPFLGEPPARGTAW